MAGERRQVLIAHERELPQRADQRFQEPKIGAKIASVEQFEPDRSHNHGDRQDPCGEKQPSDNALRLATDREIAAEHDKEAKQESRGQRKTPMVHVEGK